MYWNLTCVCTFWRVKSSLCIPWSRYLCMYVLHKSMHVCMCVYPQTMYVCMYVYPETMYVCICVYPQSMYVCMYVYPESMYLCMCAYWISVYLCIWPLLCISVLYVYRISNFMFLGPSFFIKIPFVKVVDFIARGAVRDHGHFWWMYPLDARFMYVCMSDFCVFMYVATFMYIIFILCISSLKFYVFFCAHHFSS